jgi:hypothetical protein
MTRFFFSSFFLVALVCSLGILIGPTQPVFAGMGGYEAPGPPWPNYWLLWPGGRVPVFISPDGFTEDQRIVIREGLNTWRDKTHGAVWFDEVLEKPANPPYVHILTPAEYDPLYDDPPVLGCMSWGPHVTLPTYTVLTAPDCINLPSIIHEIGHAIDLGHEQLRPDRGLYMTFEDPFVPKWPGDNEPDPWPEEIGPDPVGFFDYYSYMHTRTYHATPLSPDVTWPLPFYPSGGPSDGDIDTVRALYGFNIYYNSEIVRDDYAKFPLGIDPIPSIFDENKGVPTQRRCQLACAADVRCKAYTYYGIGTLGEDQIYPLCFLYDTDSNTLTTSGGKNIHSGERRDGQNCSFGVAFDVDLVGDQAIDGVFMQGNMWNGNNCKDLCAQDPGCDAFTFIPGVGIGTCYKIPPNSFTYQRQYGSISGVVRGANNRSNLAPTSNAGGPYTQEWAGSKTTVALNGRGSWDPEGSSLAYFWTTDCPAFDNQTFNDPTSSQPTLTVSTAKCCSQCNVSLIVTDDQCFRSTRDSTTITIQDTTAPTLVGVPPNQNVQCATGVPPAPNVTAKDNCDTNPVVTRTSSKTPVDGGCEDDYTLTRTWTAVDDCGNSTTATQTITVKDTQSPDIFCHNPFTMTPPEAPISFAATATDNCSSATPQITGFDCRGKKDKSKLESCVVTFSGSTITIHDSGGVGDTISWDVQATDSCGNTKVRRCEILVVNPKLAKP